MADSTFFSTLVQDHYGVNMQHTRLHAESSDDKRVIYRVDHSDGTSWLLRAYRCDNPVPAWLV